MAIYRLTGGITPPTGTDPRTFPGIWNNMAPQFEVAQAEVSEVTDGLDNLVLNNAADVDIILPEAGEILEYNGSKWGNKKPQAFNSIITFPFTFTWVNPNAILASPIVRVTMAGGGGGGGGGQGDGSVIGGFGGNGGSTTFTAGSFSQITPGGGGGAGAGTASATDQTFGWNAGNNGYGGQCNNASGARSAGTDGSGGVIRSFYVDLTGASSVVMSVGSGGAGGTAGSNAAPGSAGVAGWVMIEYASN